ncbi:MAG: hypothetical protein HYS60_01295 [Candidatus Wildermuthbacteria bacterium]|nr:hypothetical protein [Candidatus Wildermuthbacteria bacterium]
MQKYAFYYWVNSDLLRSRDRGFEKNFEAPSDEEAIKKGKELLEKISKTQLALYNTGLKKIVRIEDQGEKVEIFSPS